MAVRFTASNGINDRGSRPLLSISLNEPMRARNIFLILIAPLILWAVVHSWIRLNINCWAAEASETPLPLATRILLVVDNNIVRYLPIVGVGVIILGPLLALVFFRIPGAVPWPASVTECVNETSVTLRSWLILAILAAVSAFASLILGTGSTFALTTLLTWASFVSYLFSLVCAYAVQEHLARCDRSRYGGGWVIGVAFALHLCFLVLMSLLLPAVVLSLLVPTAVYFRCRYERRYLEASA